MPGEREQREIILVDNGSKESDRNALISEINKRNFQIDKIVWLERNLGFGAGMNAGIMLAKGDLVIALNSDVVIGQNILRTLKRECPWNSKTGFLAMRVNHMRSLEKGWEFSDQLQGEAVCLTSYCSCYPIAVSEINQKYILGPPGCLVAMTRELISALMHESGFIYDPHVFLYGEDVDLYLRAKQLGYKTVYVRGSAEDFNIAWHIGSGSTADGTIQTLHKSPEMIRNILDGMWENALLYSGRLELPIIVALQLLFRIIFYYKYAFSKSIKECWKLLWLSRRPRRKALKGKRPFGFWLLGNMGCLYRKPFPWTR
jgi:GT2 family glycosyltransferase